MSDDIPPAAVAVAVEAWGEAWAANEAGSLAEFGRAFARATGDVWSFDLSKAPRDGSEIVISDGLDVCAGFWSTADNRRAWADPAGN